MFVSKAAVVGAGAMGGEIAYSIADAGIRALLKDVKDEFVQQGLDKARAPLAVEQIKRVSAAGELDARLDAEKQAFLSVFGTADAREGIGAFLEKRTPRFEGR